MAGETDKGGSEKGVPDKGPDDPLRNIRRAIYYLIWKRTGFGEQCIHCGHNYPGHENKCKAAEIEALIR